jgi:hypothetical protein
MKRDPWVLIGMAVVAVTAIAASFTTLIHLALWVGWDGRIAWLLPLCIDVLALASGRVWLSTYASLEARRFARAASFATIGVSILGNATGHIVAMDNRSVIKVVLAIIVGSIPPAALAVVGHLATLATMHVEPEPVVEVESVPAPEVEPVPAEQQETKKTRRPGRPKTKEPIARAFWDSEREAGRIPSGAELARAANADPKAGWKWRKAWLAEEAQHSPELVAV